MKFLNPSGLWLLLGIPVLIIIYLIKAQHEERPVSSTYIWRLSERFMKKRLPMRRIRKMLMFVLQLLLITAAAFIVSRPSLVNGDRCDYIAIIDTSASMQTADATGTTRFDYAIEQVEELAKQINEGHTFSVILASDSASYLVQKSTSVNEVKHALDEVECTYGVCNTEDALSQAQLLYERSEYAEVYFFTDCKYAETENITVVNLNRGEWNVSVESLSAKTEGENTIFTGSVVSYGKDATVTVGLKINGSLVDAQQIDCISDTATEIVFTETEASVFDTAEIYIEEKDGLSADNAYAICNRRDRTYDVLLISKSPLYLESALNALGNCEVSVVRDVDVAELSGFDLYIFDGDTPEEYPVDGSVVVFGTENLPEGLNVASVSNEVANLSKNNEIQSDIYEELSLSETVVANYGVLTGNTSWEPLLFCNNAPVFMTSKLDTGMQISVLSFDLHDTNLPMQTDFVIFMRNIVKFSVPSLVKDMDYAVGETVEITVMPDTEELHMELPDGTREELPINENPCTLKVEEIGIYTVERKATHGGEYANFFVHVSAGETAKTTDSVLNLSASSKTSEQSEKEEAFSEIWFWLAAVMLVVLLVEWGWYYHEQY